MRGDFGGGRQHCYRSRKKKFGNAGLAGRDNRGQAGVLMDGGCDRRFVLGGRQQWDIDTRPACGGRLGSAESGVRRL